MPHVDDGQLHAYLDGALPGGVEARRRLEAHVEACEDCRALLESARADREGAGHVLGLLGPSDVELPPFEQIAARRSAGARAASGAASARPKPSRTLLSPATLAFTRAAVILIALGAGWVARGVLETGPSGGAEPVAQVALAERPQDAAAPPVPTEPAPEPAATPAPLPAAPPAPAALERPAEVADAPLEEAAARQAVPSAAAPAGSLGLAARAAQPAAAPARTDVLEEQANAVSADEAVAGSRVQAVGGLAALDPAAVTGDTWTSTNPAEATARLGRGLLEIEGLPWSRMEVAEIDGTVLVRTFHPVGGQVVELVQGAAIPDGAADTAPPQEAAAESRAPAPAVAGQRGGLSFLLSGADAATLQRLSDQLR